MDNDGREPNRSQAASWTQIKAVLTNYFKNPENQSIHKLRYTDGAGGGGGQVGPFGGENGPRYIHTENYGWIDLGHFFQVASEVEKKASTYNKVTKWAIKHSEIAYFKALSELGKKTIEVENGQPEGSETQWSYEDGPSNKAGLDFWYLSYDGDKTLLENLEDFFETAGATNPEEAPNYETMQDGPQKKRWFQQNKSLAPVQNPEPTKDNKKVNPDKKEKKEKTNNSKATTTTTTKKTKKG
jgi:hypothetical protein